MKNWLIAILIFPSALQAQFHDNTWILGYSNNADTTDRFGISILTFPNGMLQIMQNPVLEFNFDGTNMSFSNSNGNLSYYSNGIHIGNAIWDIMENGAYLTEGYSPIGGVFWPGWVLSIPMPEEPSKHCFFYEQDSFSSLLSVYARSLNLAIIDIAANDGNGTVLLRDSLLIEDTLAVGKISSIKHANGRDWWILVNEKNSNGFYRLLLSPIGLLLEGHQNIGVPVIDGVGQAVFSPNGEHYAIFGAVSVADGNYTDVYDFDRCTGLLSNHRHLHTNVTNGYWGGEAFSLNSRFLYINEQSVCHQYDLNASDLWDSRKIVAEYDGFLSPYPTTFFFMQLAPDGKIYSCTVTGSNVLHVIRNPDELGTSCQYQQHGIMLPTNNSHSIPTFPNYRLGPLDGSPCDTLGLDNLPISFWRSEQDTLDPLAVAFHDLSYYEPDTWVWDFGDPASIGMNTSTERHPQHHFSAPGEYEVCLTVSNANASNTRCRTLHLGTSLAENAEIQERIQINPNPFRDRLSVALSANLRSPIFRLFDQTGRLLREARLAFGITEIETGVLPPGMYFYGIEAQGEVVKSGKLVKIGER